MNWYAIGAAFFVGMIAGITFMILMIEIGFSRARAAFNKTPEE